jgi:hypothetical protein
MRSDLGEVLIEMLDKVKTTRFAAVLLASATFAGCTAELGGGSSGSGLDEKEDDKAISSSGGSAGQAQDDSAIEAQLGSRFGLAARLSKIEYQNSILDVLHVNLLPEELDEKAGGIPNDTGDGVFKHLADNQTSVEQHALAYFNVAEGVASRVDVPALISEVGGCTMATEECGRTIIEAVGSRLYRRPLDERELEAMLTVYRAAIEEQLDHTEATRWTLVALLQTPQFLFRMENETAGQAEQPRALDGYELAARLAAFLWVSVPDEALLAVASDDSLLQTDVLDTQVERMLADEKAQRFTEVFAIDFSRARFASYEGATDTDRQALNESVIATFQDHFWTQSGSVADLFTTTRFMVNSTVADLLGLPAMGPGLEPVDVADLPERIGLMSHPGMIAGMGDLLVGSFVNRGKYLMERLLCRHPIAFPGNITTELDQFNADTAGLNERERAEVRMTRGPCWSCHKQFEPLAFGFARFDGAGRYVGESDMDGKPLPLDGWVPTGEEAEPEYVDVETYMQVLATNPVIQTCMTEHFIDFATSRVGDDVGKVTAEEVSQEYAAKGSTLSAMVAAVVKSPLFQTIISSKGTQP